MTLRRTVALGAPVFPRHLLQPGSSMANVATRVEESRIDAAYVPPTGHVVTGTDASTTYKVGLCTAALLRCAGLRAWLEYSSGAFGSNEAEQRLVFVLKRARVRADGTVDVAEVADYTLQRDSLASSAQSMFVTATMDDDKT